MDGYQSMLTRAVPTDLLVQSGPLVSLLENAQVSDPSSRLDAGHHERFVRRNPEVADLVPFSRQHQPTCWHAQQEKLIRWCAWNRH